MDDVARAAGVSRALVSLVMRDSPKVSDARRERVLRAAERLGYRPNAMARGLASKRTRTVGVLLNELHNPFYAEIMDGIEEGAAEHDYRVLIGTAGRRAGGEEATLETFLELRADGIVLVGPRLADPPYPRSRRGDARRRRRPRHPVARTSTRSRRTNAPARARWCGTWSSSATGGSRMSTAALAPVPGRGARATARRCASTAWRTRSGSWRATTPTWPACGPRNGCSQSGDLPTAVFAANDLLAAGLIDRLEDDGLGIPGDVSVIGYDNTFLAALHHLSLTTVDQPRPAMGRFAMAALVERMEGTRTAPSHVRVTPSLIVRGSTAPPRAM